MICVFLLGFSSGLPLLLIGSTFRIWMAEAGVELTTIGLFAWAQLPYSLKFLWAPLMDRYRLPFLDRRRGWILVCQLALAVSLALLALNDPASNLWLTAAVCFLVAFCSASQDIAIDAYRREVLKDEELGLGSSVGIAGYRVAMLLAGAGALFVAEGAGWQVAYFAMMGSVLVCIAATLWAPSPSEVQNTPHTLRAAVIEPIKEFLGRSYAWEILLFILLFKIGDQMASDMFGPLYVQIGFSKTQIAEASKFFGFWASIFGGFLGGVILLRQNLFRCLWMFGILQALSTLGFSVLASLGAPSLLALTLVVAFENVSSGMGSAAYVAFIAYLTDKRFTAAQYALLSSLMSVPRVVFGGASGKLATVMGWQIYFLFCTLIAVPGLLMLVRSRRWGMGGDLGRKH